MRTGHSLRVKATKEPQGELHQTWPRAGSGSVHSKYLETLPLQYKVHRFNRSQKPTTHPKPEGGLHETTAMGRATKRLWVRDMVSSGQGQRGNRFPEPERILRSPSKDTNHDHTFSPIFTDQGGHAGSLITWKYHEWSLVQNREEFYG